jgi:Flp pilus assembly protein TadG
MARHSNANSTRRKSRQRGQSIVELALLAPVLMALLAGAIEIGRLAYVYMTLVSAARAGVQYGAQNSGTAIDIAGMRTAAVNDATNITGVTATPSYFCKCFDGTTYTANSTCALSSCTGSSILILYVQVVTAATFNTLTHYPVVPSSLSLSSTAVMRVEQ